jgi:hypothetical protein
MRGCKSCRCARGFLAARIESFGKIGTIYEQITAAQLHLRTCPHATDEDRKLAEAEQHPIYSAIYAAFYEDRKHRW